MCPASLDFTLGKIVMPLILPCLTDLINMHPHPHSLVEPSCILEGHFKLDMKKFAVPCRTEIC